MINVTEARTLVGRRVCVVTQSADGLASQMTGWLQGVPSETCAYLDGVNLRNVVSIEWAPVLCERCLGKRDKVNAETGWCADCTRREATERRGQPYVSLCDDCEQPGAFRNPARENTVLRCARCHVKAGSLPVDYSVVTAATSASCRGADKSDVRHAWRKIKSSRWVCVLCQTHTFEQP